MPRLIIGGAIGAAIGAAVWLGLENTLHRNLSWMVVAVGLCAGFGVRLTSKPNQRGSLTGAIAAVMALLGMVGGNFANAAMLQSKTAQTPLIGASPEKPRQQDAANATREEVRTLEGTDAQNEQMRRSEATPDVPLPTNARPPKPANWDLIFYCVGCFLAYLAGGSGTKVVAQEAAVEPGGPPPTEPSSGDDQA